MAYSIGAKCLGCHYCALECPAGAIDYIGTKYEIDTAKCIECGQCVDLCNVSAITDGKEKTVTPHTPTAREADIVVIGCGGGGAVAAVRAAQLSGKKVVVLEKAKKPGGSAWFAGFMLSQRGGGGPPMPFGQNVEITPDTDSMTIAMGRRKTNFEDLLPDPELIAAAKASQLDVSEWLMSFDSIKEYLVETEMFGKKRIGLPDTRLLRNFKSTDNAIGPGRSGSFFIEMMLAEFDEYGVELLCEHRAVEILTDRDGTVCGVVAENPGGTITISCKAAICLTGGFAHNDDMLRKYAPWFFPEDESVPYEPVHRFAAPTCTGDIVKLGESAGAYIDHDAFYVNLFGPVHHPFSFSLFKIAIEGEAVHVTREGRRYFDESYFGNGAEAICYVPTRDSYSIFSEETLAQAARRLCKGREGSSIARYREDMKEELGSNNGVSFFVADTLEELADKAGINMENLVATIARYNEMCARGSDEDFGKLPQRMTALSKGPYYAIYGKMATDGAFGGVLVNKNTEVWNAEKSGVVPGLYAAGDCAAGLALAPGGPGDNRRKAVGDCSWAVGGGFMAANAAVEYLG